MAHTPTATPSTRYVPVSQNAPANENFKVGPSHIQSISKIAAQDPCVIDGWGTILCDYLPGAPEQRVARSLLNKYEYEQAINYTLEQWSERNASLATFQACLTILQDRHCSALVAKLRENVGRESRSPYGTVGGIQTCWSRASSVTKVSILVIILFVLLFMVAIILYLTWPLRAFMIIPTDQFEPSLPHSPIPDPNAFFPSSVPSTAEPMRGSTQNNQMEVPKYENSSHPSAPVLESRTAQAYRSITVTGPYQFPDRDCSPHILKFILQLETRWITPKYLYKCQGAGILRDKVRLTGLSHLPNVQTILCDVANTITSLTFLSLELNLKYPSNICSLNDSCHGENTMSHLQELQVLDVNMKSSSCIFEILETFEFPRLEVFRLRGLDISGYNAKSLRRIIAKSAPTLKVLDVSAIAMKSRAPFPDSSLSIVTNEICEQFLSEFKIVIDWWNLSPEYQNFIDSIRAHSKCRAFIRTRGSNRNQKT